MSIWFTILTIVFIIVSATMVLIILVQRPQGGGLAGAFGGAGGTGSDTVFGGRVGDALTVMTVIAFVVYLGLAVGLNLMDASPTAAVVPPAISATDTSGSTDGVPPAGQPVVPPVPGPREIPVTPVPSPFVPPGSSDQPGPGSSPPASGDTPQDSSPDSTPPPPDPDGSPDQRPE